MQEESTVFFKINFNNKTSCLKGSRRMITVRIDRRNTGKAGGVMESSYFTIGMAGHIDHGKTTLTKALTNIETDRLKEEKERNISIELGYAPLHTDSDVQVSIVDVPGHERFIRQMIAGVAGIDLVILVIAADEGVMPQTKEHLEILSFLGIQRCMVAISKIDRVDDELLELVEEEITETLEKTPFKGARLIRVDSVSGKGIELLKETIIGELKSLEQRDRYGSYRLPIDQVFTVQGQGTIVRGTIYEGVVKKGSQLKLLPSEKTVRARSIQVHHNDVEEARAGQRTAINLGGISREEVKRGDVLVASDHFLVTNIIDVAMRFVDDLRFPVKQRTPVKIHIGTSEVMGNIVFFDRNVVEAADEEVLCQIRLEEEIVARRGDRFIVRRPTPAETIGGGWVIEPKGSKYKFGQSTVDMLQNKQQGSPKDLVEDALKNRQILTEKEIIQDTSLDQAILKEIVEEGLEEKWLTNLPAGKYVLTKDIHKLETELVEELSKYHNLYPMRTGGNKAEITQILKSDYSKEIIEFVMQRMTEKEQLASVGPLIRIASFTPHLPSSWKKRMEEVIDNLARDGLEVKKWNAYLEQSSVPEKELVDLDHYLINNGYAHRLSDDMIIHQRAFEQAVQRLREQTGTAFDLKEAKDALNVSRKFLIPFLELLDNKKVTKREDTKRIWILE